MKNRTARFVSILTVSLGLFSATAAVADDAVIGALIGAGAGAVVGSSVGGRDGAVVGGMIGAAAGAAIGNDNGDRPRRSHRVGYAPPPPYHAQPVYYYDAPPPVHVVRSVRVVEQPVYYVPSHSSRHNHHRHHDRHDRYYERDYRYR
ncbi:YMGG-like glycine zipper-containing protein [Propionivibrio limicola]|uniref:YMGG-like glycine zipper-containing protein n=1 Tax=Propionivibrio limicola TaxID=167645 RepID=UPI001291C090|nr:YMGG-like glycine zipper-containing protein [Propionivibrio limicola]